MAKGPRYRVPYRRRREGKTDYKARRVMATSDRPRFVVRPSSHNITIQVSTSKIEGDYTLTQAHSSELEKKYGWKGSKKNTPAAYLLGLLAGRKALSQGIKQANLDVGIASSTKGSKIFAAVKGAIDAGLGVACDSDFFPEPARLQGETISKYAGSIEDPEVYQRQFSDYIKRGLKPENLPEHFEQVKVKIEKNQSL